MKLKSIYFTLLIISSLIMYSACKKQEKTEDNLVAEMAIESGFIQVTDSKQSNLDPIVFDSPEEALSFLKKFSEKSKNLPTVQVSKIAEKQAIEFLQRNSVKEYLLRADRERNKLKSIKKIESRKISTFSAGGEDSGSGISDDGRSFGSSDTPPPNGYDQHSNITFDTYSLYPNVSIQTNYSRDGNGNITDWSASVSPTGFSIGGGLTVDPQSISHHTSGASLVYQFTGTTSVTFSLGGASYTNSQTLNYLVTINPDNSVYARSTNP